MIEKNIFSPGFMLLADIEDDYDVTGKTNEHDGGASGNGGNNSSNPPTEPINATFSINDN